MSLFTILEVILLGPLKLVFEILFSIAYRITAHPGIAIIALSLIMNILVLPLYRRADAMQEQVRDKEARLQKGIRHIRKTFSGDERMMILQTYYKQNHYSPLSSLSGSVSLLLEIPFFMAAYQFLSNLTVLHGASFGPIADLGVPDKLLVLGNGMTVNVLPIIMTLINIFTSAIYLKGFPLKSKIQLYGMACIFLVLLYTSPSGLVFYWTLNNVFSLVKTCFYKMKNPGKVLAILCSIAGVGILFYDFVIYEHYFPKLQIFMALVGILLQVPLLISVFGKKLEGKPKNTFLPDRKVFVWCSLFLTVLIGLMIPVTFVAASPQEFVNVASFYHPVWYVVEAFCMAAGIFLVWLQVFYWLANDFGKVVFEKIAWIFCGVTLIDYMFFGTNLGILSSTLKYENGLVFSGKEQLVNLVVLLAVSAVLYVVLLKWKQKLPVVLLVALISMTGMSAVKLVDIDASIDKLSSYEQSEETPNFALSKTGQNVIVFMLDRAMGEYIPYLFNEKPELEEMFDGFTYYANTISHGGHTTMGATGLLGGYEYTPVELNKRDTESLVSKHDEANLVMPVLFDEHGFEVTVCDPVITGFQWIPDLSIYEAYPDIDVYNTGLSVGNADDAEKMIESTKRNLFCFSLMKTMPLCLQSTIYNDGTYNQVVDANGGESAAFVAESYSKATGPRIACTNEFRVLQSLPDMTNVTEENQNTFLFFSNDITHEPTILQTPEYVPQYAVDNTEYDAANSDRFELNGRTLIVDDFSKMAHYHVNMAALLQLGEWFDYMRENDVFDNTKIILVSDHGHCTYQMDELMYDKETREEVKDLEYYYPLLMVKDFGSEGFETSYEFMTNADVPTLATRDVIENPINPFTGNLITDAEKTAHDQMISASENIGFAPEMGNEFPASKWASVKDDLWNLDNWTFYDEMIVLKEHKLPEE